MLKHIAVIGGGVAGLAAAYELGKLQRSGADLTFTLIEATGRLGGILETARVPTSEGEFIVECGPDGWVTEKPWARDLAIELGLEDELIPSNDADRVTYVLHGGKLEALPDGMRMMVPASLDNLRGTPLFNAEALAAYAAESTRGDELKAAAPSSDESVASFVKRHFGDEVLRTVAAPLLGGIFGGDVAKLSVRAVMKPFVQMEQEHGSLILAAQARNAQQAGKAKPPIFTSLRSGTGTLAEAMARTLPTAAVRLRRRVSYIERSGSEWKLQTDATDAPGGRSESMLADHVLLAAPIGQARALAGTLDPEAASLMQLSTSSAAIVAFGFSEKQAVAWPKGFGFLVPESENAGLLAATFCDQKYAHRAPHGARLIRAYYGGLDVDATGKPLPPGGMRSLAYGRAKADLEQILGPLPSPVFTVERVWPRALPQYEVGHVDRMQQLDDHIRALGRIHLLGNAYRGVGLPELIRDAREAARQAASA